ncbi:MAG: ATP-binding protein [Gammaproteobacteria bacterium]|nr:ATP-binding protein [Gammaproteobacteria bacterium]
MTTDATLINDVLNKANRLLDRLESLQNPLKNQLIEKNSFALRWCKNQGVTSIKWESPISQDSLLHIDRQAKLLLDNTQQFVKGFPANNALLWGSRGTGKSSLIQAILGEFTYQQLRVIEINHSDFSDWADIVNCIKSNQPQKFILFCDDLSFNEDDSSYKDIKAALDGSLTSLPKNSLIYATSNRRHLLPEKLADNQHAQHIKGEIHHAEAIEEAISLSDRFGLWLSFHALTQDQYLSIVEHWLKIFGIKQNQNEYRELALRWALQRGSRSGRIANQFARDYAGKYLLNN